MPTHRIQRPSRLSPGWLASLLYLAAASVVSAAEPTREQLDFFENDIRPLLVKHCYECHGPDKQEGELRLDGRALLLHGGASGPAAVATKPSESLLIEAVQYRSLEMPPNGKLPADSIAKLTKWVEMGLPWTPEAEAADPAMLKSKTFTISDEQKQHWSFRPIQNPTPPKSPDQAWNNNPVDQFLAARWQAAGVQPAEVADRGTLLRRVTYDLTGLPPTIEELKQFLADESPDAWQRVVDRLLASPHYGERWGRHWMDVVRYADTAGDASDYPVPDAYKYRNYIIKSFNEDKPYDQFLREQYAGDLLAADAPPEKYEELAVATTHLALARRFGYNDTNFYYFHLTIHDLLDVMGQSVLGLSVGCARCHDHKFEPVSAKDYYALYGIFSSSKFTFPGAEEITRPKDLVPAVPPAVAAERERERQERAAEFDRRLAEVQLPLLNLEGSFEASKEIPAAWGRDPEAELTAASSPFTNVFPQGAQAVQLPNSPKNLGIRRPIPLHTPATTTPLYLNIDFCNAGAEAGGDGYYRIALDHPENNFSPGAELFINAQQAAVRDGAGFKQIAPLKLGAWYNLQLQVDWPAKRFSGVISDGQEQWTFADVPFNPSWDGIVNSWVVDGHVPGNDAVRPRRQLDNFAIQTTPFPAATEKTAHTITPSEDQAAKLREAVESVRKEREAFMQQASVPTVYGVVEGKPANARIQLRGEPERLGDEAPRAFLEILGGEKLPDNCQESGRRQLADWLTSPENPLTARVMVNRIWHYHFGRGIVSTPNDFGVRGSPPSHPELLDYLASQFQQAGYSIKAMHRLILTSRAYQLSTAHNDVSQQLDPDNNLFWRRQRQRLDAESLRDAWLTLSGELDLTVGGPHPFPPVSSWRFSQHNPFDAVYASNQRTVYLMTQRIKRHPFLALFDGPDPNATTGKRELTTTPSQALFMMNDDFLHLRAKAYAQRLLSATSDEREQTVRVYQEAYSRSPTSAEIEAAQGFRRRYEAKTPDDPNRAAAGLAAYLRVILCSNEFLYLN